VTTEPDPILERRARIRRLVSIGQRVGYAAMGLAVVVFAIGAASGFPAWTVVVTITALVVSIAVLPVPIVLSYGVRAAEREDRGRPSPGRGTG
jgi:anaerobic C4-dicarboxylate transporter